MISEQLGRYPILLDELIDPQQLYNPVPLESYRTELRDFLARIPEDDMEQQMEALRQFKQICIFTHCCCRHCRSAACHESQ